MQSPSTRIAYIKRMLKRLDDEESRLKVLIVAGSLTPEEAELGAKQLQENRERLSAELRNLEPDAVT
jgi:hypothetical protein